MGREGECRRLLLERLLGRLDIGRLDECFFHSGCVIDAKMRRESKRRDGRRASIGESSVLTSWLLISVFFSFMLEGVIVGVRFDEDFACRSPRLPRGVTVGVPFPLD